MANTSDSLKKRFIAQISEPNPGYEMICLDENHYKMTSDYAEGEINFYDQDIVEFRIVKKETDEVKFFIHFQLNDPAHSSELFLEMKEVFLNLKNERTTRILLCCTSGLTTSFFAQQLNAAAQILCLDYHFDAVDWSKVFQSGNDYDVILIAPQAAHKFKSFTDVFRDRLVMRIPSRIFGSYDCGALIETVRSSLRKKRASSAEVSPIRLPGFDDMPRTLAISILNMAEGTKAYVRLYENGKIIFDRETIKAQFWMSDFYDILDTVMAQYQDIRLIGVSLPGIVNEGHVKLPLEGFDNTDVAAKLQAYSGIPCFVTNDTNAAAVGWCAQQDQYDNIVFHFQPTGHYQAGQGIVINRCLITGLNSIAGEIKYLVPEMQYSGNPDEMIWTPEGALEIVVKFLIAVISVLGPQAICLQSDMTPDTEQIIKKLRRNIPSEYIPEIIQIRDMKEYMFLGTLILGQRELIRQTSHKK